MMKRKNRIGRLLISVLLLFFCLSVLLLLIGGYFVHSRDIDNLYKEQAGRLSVAATSFMDGDFLAGSGFFRGISEAAQSGGGGKESLASGGLPEGERAV